MCYAIPGKVKKIEDKTVIIDYFGEERKAYNELDSVCLNDYVYAQGGYVIKKIPLVEAESILLTWRETFFELQEVDLRLSQMDLSSSSSIDKKLTRILDKTLEGIDLNKDELIYLLELKDEQQIALLCKSANFLRQKYLKNSCCVHGILEISSYCQSYCSYCGISAYNKNISRYRMSLDQIIKEAYNAIENLGFKALVLQSGEDLEYSLDDLVYIIKTIKKNSPALICISFGEIGELALKTLYKAGARGLLLRFETSNPELYSRLHPGRKLETRLSEIKEAYNMGYLIFTGGLIGLPGQTNQDILNDLYLTKQLNAEMYSFGPFLPHPDTPLKDFSPIDYNYVLKFIALARIMGDSESKILVTTAFETLNSQARKKGLLSGANSVMLNVTPVSFREKYSIYPNRVYNNTDISQQIQETISLLRQLGRAPTDFV